MNIKELPISIQEKINTLPFNPIPAKKDIIGKVFNRLTVLGRGEDYISPSGKHNSQWWCICDCPEHNILLVRISNLTSNNTKSCGCLNKETMTKHITLVGQSMAKDITNQRFGELIAIQPTEKRKNGSIIWKCQCSCGKIHYATQVELSAGRVTSCGCKRYESLGCRKIKNILLQNNIPFILEKTFPNCRFPETNGIPRFDFYINNEFLLEYDGEQHFMDKDTNYFKDKLITRQKNDLFKNQWCKENYIPLKRIPYTELNNITFETIMDDTYLII